MAVFAYNEQELITSCLDSIRACPEGMVAPVHVLINGCTDRTEEIVRAYAQQHRNIIPVVITRGDKANAWNHYVHQVAPAARVHCFMDGDMMITEGSLAGLIETLAAHPEANATASLPVSGRNQSAFRDKLIRNRELAGNCYALQGAFLERIRVRQIRLPIGMFGEDGLVTTLARWDLNPAGGVNPNLVVPSQRSGFHFESLSPFRPSHWRIYWNRKMRYAVRYQQAEFLYSYLVREGLEKMPAHVVDLYVAHRSGYKLKWRGLNTLFDFIAIRRLKRKIAQGEQAKAVEEARLYS